MKKFILSTEELVNAFYLIEAETKEEAIDKFKNNIYVREIEEDRELIDYTKDITEADVEEIDQDDKK